MPAGANDAALQTKPGSRVGRRPGSLLARFDPDDRTGLTLWPQLGADRPHERRLVADEHEADPAKGRIVLGLVGDARLGRSQARAVEPHDDDALAIALDHDSIGARNDTLGDGDAHSPRFQVPYKLLDGPA